MWNTSKMMQLEALSVLAALPGSMALKPLRDAELLPIWSCSLEEAHELGRFLLSLNSARDVAGAAYAAMQESFWGKQA